MKKLMFILAMTVFGSIGIFRTFIPLSSTELALWRTVFALVLVGGYLLIKKSALPIKEIKKELLLLAVSGIAMGFNWVLLFESYRYTTVAVSTLSYYFAPVLVMIISPFLFKEKLTLKGALSFVVATFGLVLIIVFGDNSGGSGEHLKGVLFGLSAAVLYASVVLINKFIKSVTGLHRTFVQFVCALAVLLPFSLLTTEISAWSLDLTPMILLIIVGVVHTGIAYCMYFSSLKDLSGQQVAVLSYIDPLLAVVLSVIILKDPLSVWQIVGGAMILGATLFSEIKIKNKKVAV